VIDVVINRGPRLVSFEAFGVSMWVATNRDEAFDRLPEILPPGWRSCSSAEATHRLGILCDERGTYAVDLGGAFLIEGVSLDVALDSLATVVRLRIASEAPDRIFVRAGVVGHAGGALLIPGGSFTGKTTLIAALVRAGASYYSDEYAALDADGLVHAFPTPLSIRGGERQPQDHLVEPLEGGSSGKEPLPVRAVIATTYRPGADWTPKALDAGDAALALLAHAVPVRERPAEALRAITRAVDNAVALESDRGEAEDLAPILLAELEARAS
jgi:hypothetical protein